MTLSSLMQATRGIGRSAVREKNVRKVDKIGATTCRDRGDSFVLGVDGAVGDWRDI
jgi:hypothetical protein